MHTLICPFFFLTAMILASHTEYWTSQINLVVISLSTSALTLAARLGCIRLGACFTGHRSGSMARQCIAIAGSKPGISEYVHANTSRFCFRTSRYTSFSLGDRLYTDERGSRIFGSAEINL